MEEIKDASQLSDEIVEMINRYSWKYDDRANAELLIRKVVKALDQNYGIDTHNWTKDLKENLDDAYDY